MPAAGSAVEPIELKYPFLGSADSNVQVTATGLADRPPNRTRKSCEKRFWTTPKIQRMAVECHRGSRPRRAGASSPNFEVLPFSITSQFAKQSRDDDGIASAKEEGIAKVTERQANAPASRERTAYLQKGNHGYRFSVFGEEQ